MPEANPLEGAMGGWWFFSSVNVPFTGPTSVCRAAIAPGTSAGFIAEFRVVPGSTATAGGVYTAIDYDIRLRYQGATGVVQLVSTTPLPDPALGLAITGVPRSSWAMAWRFALVFRCSTWDEGTSTYAADGYAKLFVNGSATPLLSAVGVTIPRRLAGNQIRYTVAALGDGDRIWARPLAAVPATGSDGAFTAGAPADLMYFTDFDAGATTGWTPIDLSDSGGFEPAPHTWPDCGGGGGWGMSIYASGPNDAVGESGVVNHPYAGLTRLASYPSGGGGLEPPEIAPVTVTDERWIRRLRRAPHVTHENVRVFVKTFELDLERGQGLATGQGSDPIVLLRLSRDGGQTWGEEVRLHAGALGAYTQRVIARRLGHARDLVFEVTVSDPIAWSLVGAWLDVEGGTS